MERKREIKRSGPLAGREKGPTQARRLSYEEERRRRDQPWSPSQQPEMERDATMYTDEGRASRRRPAPNDLKTSGSAGNRGKGPKGYTRSDDRIKEIICDRMMEDDQLDASEITVKVENGEVTLTGTVAERAAKRYAEELVDEVVGVSNVQNSIRVAPSH